jgi:hypothetical protein
MATVRDLIKGSLRLIGAVASGETPGADEQADALSSLNDMIDSWSTEQLTIYTSVREVFDLVGGKQSYTMGTGGDFATSRPMRIERAALLSVSSGNLETPLEIINLDDWAEISQKSSQSSPQKLFPDNAYPLENLSLYPTPDVANKLVLYSWKPLTSFASVNDTVSFPPGYAKALRYGLALELAPEYGKQVDPSVVIQFTEAKENIKRQNVITQQIVCDAAVLSSLNSYNILTGQ